MRLRMAVLWLSLILLPRCAGPGSSSQEPVVRSPRLAALRESLRSGGREALRGFWEEIERQGAPLVEPIPGDERNLLVTFLDDGGWRTKGVVVLGSVAHAAPMSRLAGSDVWFHSVAVPRDARFTYRLAPLARPIPVDRGDPRYDLGKIQEHARFDPLNPRRFPRDASGSEWYTLSLVELPEAPPQPWLAPRPGVRPGRVEETAVRTGLLGGERRLDVYTPAGFRKEDGPYPLLVLLDGWSYLELISLPTILDNLIASGEIPPLVAVLVTPPDPGLRDGDLECSESYGRFLAEELIPWVRERYPVVHDPARTVVGGASLGGLAAACAALARPDVFGNVLSQSGSFSWRPEHDPEPEWLRRRIETGGPALPLRVYLDVGRMEVWPTRDRGPSLLDSNRRFRDALRSRGAMVSYLEYSGGHGYANWQATLPDALRVLMKER